VLLGTLVRLPPSEKEKQAREKRGKREREREKATFKIWRQKAMLTCVAIRSVYFQARGRKRRVF
jgi:hypothetical protein